ncbi:MAG: polysaccharide pyruvyl transferase CsaB [Firmicutes bacterium]|jgi:polysaccharide pyruvyl transferase CsaB|nr:polysaccharide pyruvyl transferase CsaB [Bacillota bacterium]
MPRIVVAGYYGFGNAGDEAMLESTLEALRREIPGSQFTVLTADPEQTREAYAVDVVHRFSPSAVVAALRRADMFVFGGGSLLQDVTSLRSLLYYLSILLAAQRMGKPTMIYGNGFGPVNSPLGKAVTRLVLEGTGAITLRDAESARQVESLGVTGPLVRVTADPAFDLEPSAPSAAAEILRANGISEKDAPLVGLSVRPWSDAQALPGTVAAACDMMCDHLGATVVFIPMQGGQDCPLLREIAAKMKGRHAMIEPGRSPRDLMGCIGMLDAVIGMRLHSLVFGVAMGVPVAGITYDPKVTALLEAVGCPNAGSPRTVTAESIFDAARFLLDHSVELKRSLGRAREEMRRLAAENAVIARQLLEGQIGPATSPRPLKGRRRRDREPGPRTP